MKSGSMENTVQNISTELTYFTYILECVDATLYVGSTNDLDRRIHRHNNSKAGAHYTKIRRPVFLKYFERFATFSEAKKREAELKSWKREQKLELIAKRAPPNDL